MKTICLNMIVKNEGKNITRLLNSVEDLIDSFCIIDTGSTDNTVSIIVEYFKNRNIKGVISFKKFEDFEKNRNYALSISKGLSDYLLLLDADMILEHNIDKEKLTKDYYSIIQENQEVKYHNTRIIKNNGNFYYRGVTHEVILSKFKVSGEILDEKYAKIIDYEDGGCKENKLERDKELLLKNINDSSIKNRYYFYLANTLTALGDLDLAIEYYKKKILCQDWDQESWCCCYKLGCIYYIKKDLNQSIFYFLEAYNYVNNRVENLYYLVNIYYILKKHNISNIYLNLALEIIKNKDFSKPDLFLEKKFYDPKVFEKFT